MQTGQTGEQLKLAGIQRVSENNEDWLDWIRKIAIRLSNEHGGVSADDLRSFADIADFHPTSPNGWGAVFAGKDWRLLGYKKSKYPSNHARRISVWKYNPRVPTNA